jgi:hypothetical protein
MRPITYWSFSGGYSKQTILGGLPGLRQGINLLQEFHHGHLDPVFADLAILQAVNMNLSPVDAFIGWRLSHKGSEMGRDGGASFYNFVAARDEIFFRYYYVRESSVHHPPNLLKPLETGRQGHAEVVHEIFVEQMMNAIYIMLVLEDSSEFPHNLLIPFFLHESSFLVE